MYAVANHAFDAPARWLLGVDGAAGEEGHREQGATRKRASTGAGEASVGSHGG
jgi:hypothetical protein